MAYELSSNPDGFATRILPKHILAFYLIDEPYHDLAASIVYDNSEIDLLHSRLQGINRKSIQKTSSPATLACQHSNVANQSAHIHLYPQAARRAKSVATNNTANLFAPLNVMPALRDLISVMF